MRLLTVVAGFALALPALAQDVPKTRVEVRRAETAPADGLVEAVVTGTTQKVYLHKAAALTGADIATAKAAADGVELTFTDAGAKKAAKLSEEYADKPVALVVDGKVLAAPIIRAKLGQTIRLTGSFTAEEAAKLVKAIESR